MADPVTAAVAVGWGMKAVGWLVSPIISQILKKGFSYSSYLGFDAPKKLKQLETRLLQLERVMEAVEESPHRPRLEKLFRELKSAFYEAEDILDDIEYYRLERQINENEVKSDSGGSSRMREVKKKLQSATPRNPLKNQETGMSKIQLKNVLEKIEMIINDAYQILEHLNLPSIGNCNGREIFPANLRSTVTTGAPPRKVFGRDEERDKIIAMLHGKECDDGQQKSKSDIPYSVLGIHGIAGSGKSTLAQVVYAREKKDKQEKKVGHFDLVMWVHVSQKFVLDVIFRELMEQATGKPCPTFNSLNALQENLEEKLQGKRIFLVLDDVWYNSRDARQQELQQILCPLEFGETGSKILVTSRSKDALLALGAEERCIPIPDLGYEAFFEMFMHYALRGARIDGDDREKLEMLGDDIAKKLKRSPLAARTVGAQLCLRPNVQFWRRTKDRALLNDTMGALWWSYQHLDEQVRRCFAYCSIFPRRRRLKRKELVRLWMAEGFIKTSDAEEELDGIGEEYFEKLLSASFLQLGERRIEHGCEVDYFTIHDLLRDIAEEAARGDCFIIEKDFTGEVPPDVCHLFVGTCDIMMVAKKISELQNLRTLIFDDRVPPDDKFFQGMFKRFQKLRVLILAFSRYDGGHTFSVPECIGQLKHLRYLHFDVHREDWLILPSSITKLYHIQLLDVSSAYVVFSGGKNMNHLGNLRCLSSFEDLDIPNIGRLKWLQMLPYFNVMKKQGHELRQLKHLNKLEGRLQIKNLENVESKEDAVEASLADKERLTTLVLCWKDNTSRNPEGEAEVLEGLCPSKYVERLEIRNYNGSTYPNWMLGKQNGGPKSLHNLWLYNCTRLEPAPELFEVFVHLRWFRLWWSNWPVLPDNIGQLTSLQLLDLSHCSNICSLPALPRSLEKFGLAFCNEEFMRSCETVDDPNWQKIQHIPKKTIKRF